MKEILQVVITFGGIIVSFIVVYVFYMAFYQVRSILITIRSKQGEVLKTDKMPKPLYAQLHYSDEWLKVRFDSHKRYIRQ